MTDFSSNFAPSLVGTSAFGDLLMSNGDLVLTSDANPSGQNPVLQDVLFRLRTFQGEYFMDASIGVPWYQQLLGIKTGLASGSLSAVLSDAILSTPGVLRLDRFSASLSTSTRVLSISFAAVTVSGNVSYSSDISVGAQ